MKRKILTFLILVIFAFIGHAQYFLTSGKKWKQHDVMSGIAGNPYTIEVKYDTLVSNTIYKVVGDYYLREEGAKVYAADIYNDFKESLWYDFSLNTGDTINVGIYNESYIVNKVSDTIINDSIKRKVIYLNSNVVWIEGIGDTRGLDAVNKGFSLLNCICTSELICCTKDGETIYNNENYPNCGEVSKFALLQKGKVWNSHYEFPPYVDPVEFNGSGVETYYIERYDTLISNNLYSVVIEKGSGESYFVREVNKKVYSYNQDSLKEELWYDFSFLTIGDSLTVGLSNQTLTLDSIGTMVTNDGLSRNVQYFSNIETRGTDIKITWVEGLGDLRGIVKSTAPLNLIGGKIYTLTCTSLDDDLIYQNQNYPNCGDAGYLSFFNNGKAWTNVQYPVIPNPNYSFNKKIARLVSGDIYPQRYVLNDVINGVESNTSTTGYYEMSGIVIAEDSIGSYILYNFAANVGDSIYVGRDSIKLFVDSVGYTTLIDKISRKTLFLLNENSNIHITWIEGIGDTRGIFGSLIDIDIVGVGNQLVCVSDNKSTIYSNDKFPNCGESSYIPMLKTGAYWKDVSYYGGYPEDNTYSEHKMSFYMTNVVGVNHYILYDKNQDDNWDAYAYYWENEGKVFQSPIDDINNYDLVYDFSANVGDTVEVGEQNTKLIVDSVSYIITFDNIKRKVQNLHFINSGMKSIWIEGIGDLRGVKNSMNEYSIIGLITELACYSDNKGLIYSNPDFPDCGETCGSFVSNIDTTLTSDRLYLYVGISNYMSDSVTIHTEASNASVCRLDYTVEGWGNTYLEYIPKYGFSGIETISVIRKTNNNCMADTLIITINVAIPQYKFEVSHRVKNVSYKDGCNGAIDLYVTGGVAPYSYKWSTGDTIENLYDLKEGIYFVTVSDNSINYIVDTIAVGVQNAGEYKIEGQVLHNESGFSNCIVFAYIYTDSQVKPITYKEVSKSGYYTFTDLPKAKYLIYAIPNPDNHQNTLPTYAYNSLFATDAYVLNLKGDVTHFNIDLLEMPFIAGGNGSISGTVKLNDNSLIETSMYKSDIFESMLKSEVLGASSANIPVFLMQDNKVVAWTLTDSYGQYVFENLPQGAFSVKITNTQGLSSETTIALTETNNNVSGVNFNVTKNGVEFTNINNVTESNVLVYPNPCDDIVYIEGVDVDRVIIYDLYGNIILESNKNAIDISVVSSGTYVLKVNSDIFELIVKK